jgi:serine/threonine protein kinase
MGAVFLAERDDDAYHARVAIKLVRPGMDTDFILARFRRERQTLARLQHPNISRLLDGGTTDTGLPYIVMEYIDGSWLTQFADARRLAIKDRLRLFSDVCAAVDYAHRNFIIHRDLKPGNILVDADGVPKLLDFGICKLLRADAISGHETQMAPMTPNYASPEQVQGGPMTLLSDVYSLGAVLYELLSGVYPFAGLASEVVFAELLTRAPDPVETVDAGIPVELCRIVATAMAREKKDRYARAGELAEDVDDYLKNLG